MRDPLVRDRGHHAGLDGIRGVAILLVLGQHAPTRPLIDGFVGVTVFFCLSGYLITALLVRELRTGTIDVRAFYRRRAARLGPALVTVVAATTLVLLTDRPDLGVSQVVAPAGAALTYTTSLFDWSNHVFATKDYFNYTWSLSVEEQFYLLWPFALLWGYRRSPRQFTTLVLVLIGIALTLDLHLGLSRAVKYDQHEYFGTDTNALPILAGSLLAIAVVNGWWSGTIRRLAPAALLGLVLLPVLFAVILLRVRFLSHQHGLEDTDARRRQGGRKRQASDQAAVNRDHDPAPEQIRPVCDAAQNARTNRYAAQFRP